MAAAFELGVEEGVEDGCGLRLVDETGGQRADVGVVVLTGQGGNLGTPADGSSHFGVFVEGHADAVGAAAERYGEVALSGGYDTGQGVGIDGIVDVLFAVGSQVVDGVSFGEQVAGDELFHAVAGVVAGDGDVIGFHP